MPCAVTAPCVTPLCTACSRVNGQRLKSTWNINCRPPMLTDFFYHLRARKLPVSVQEYLTLLKVLQTRIMPPTVDDFYHLARMTLVKDETLFDRYDQAFGEFYRTLEAALPNSKEIPLDWLIKEFQKKLTPEEKAAIEKHGWDKLMELFKERLEEQQKRHAGGNKWIGTGGSSPFGQDRKSTR